uniref:Uncharacterized protein n=1 Tax=Caenorhabditis japonica TaxID=281687 RepID=A0A8R1I3T4_CAEJA
TLADNLATTSTPPSSPTPTVGPFRRSYVFMTATNKRTGKVAKTCVNYQQFQSNITAKSVIPERVEDAKPFIFKYWRGSFGCYYFLTTYRNHSCKFWVRAE